jgi:mono/diheme cytochrome c family protein
MNNDKFGAREHNRLVLVLLQFISSTKELSSMRFARLVIPLVATALIACFAVVQPALADDGAATYKAKCAVCHGPEGQGKVGPALKGTSLSADQIADLLTKGNDAKKAPHKKAMSGLSADEAKAVAAFVKTLK